MENFEQIISETGAAIFSALGVVVSLALSVAAVVIGGMTLWRVFVRIVGVGRATPLQDSSGRYHVIGRFDHDGPSPFTVSDRSDRDSWRG